MRASDIRRGQAVMIDGKLFVVTNADHNTPGNLRAKVQFKLRDVLKNTIIDKRVGATDDIETTIRDITAGRCAAIAVPDKGIEKLVVIIELKKRGASDQEAADRLRSVKREVTSAISKSRGLSVADLVLVSPGSIPITTSGKIRRSQCVELYRPDKFTRLDA